MRPTCFFLSRPVSPIRLFNAALLFGALLTFGAHSQAGGLYSEADLAVVKQAMAQAQQSDLAYELVASLTTEVGPRPAGSAGRWPGALKTDPITGGIS